MGWGRWFFLGDLGQQLDLHEQADEIQRLKEQMRSDRRQASPDLAKEIRRLGVENDQLKLYVATLFRLAVTKGLATKDELKALVQAIDAEDGEVDGACHGAVLGGAP